MIAMNHEDIQSLAIILLSLAVIVHVLTHFIEGRQQRQLPFVGYTVGIVLLIASGAFVTWELFR